MFTASATCSQQFSFMETPSRQVRNNPTTITTHSQLTIDTHLVLLQQPHNMTTCPQLSRLLCDRSKSTADLQQDDLCGNQASNRFKTIATCSQHLRHVRNSFHLWKRLYVKCETTPQPLQHLHNCCQHVSEVVNILHMLWICCRIAVETENFYLCNKFTTSP